jgi:hypothetical protein
MKKLFLLLFNLIVCANVIGQTISQYVFTQSTGTYTPIVGGTAITPTGTTYFDDYSYGPFPIGFNFTYHGVVQTQFGLNENGFISLGSTSPSSSNYSLSSGSTNDVISAFNYDLYGYVSNGAEIRYQTLGSAPNRTLVVQFKNYGFYAAPKGLADFNFQFILYETSNVVTIMYGPYAGTSGSNTLQVGLRGASNADFCNRTTTTNWAATTAGATNAVTCSYTPPSVIPSSGLTFSWAPPAPCAAPLAQATGLLFTPTTTSIALSWTNSASADTYLVLRSTNPILGATPVNGTLYTVGNTFGNGVVDYWGSGPNYVSAGLASGTTYYFWIYAANNACIGTPPVYLLTSPLNGLSSTLIPTPRCGNYTVGPTGFFPSLTAAFADLASNGVTCAVNLQLQASYISTVETYPVAITAIPGTTAVNTVTVYPLAAGLSVTSANAVGTINMTGANYVTFDGRVNGTGVTKSLTLDNTSTGYTVGFQNGANYDGVKYCIVRGANTTGTYGTIQFMGTTTTNGNSNNTIDNCEIRDGSFTPMYAIASSGSASGPLYNKNNTVSNCLIHDFAAQPTLGGNPIGVAILGGSTGWTITGNSFYMTYVMSPTVAVGYNVIFLAAGDGYTVTNNFIGGSAPNCGGTPWTLNGNGTPPTIANFIYAIRFQTGGLTVNASTVSNNTVANMVLYTNPTASSIFFTGFLSAVGIQNLNGNVIGAGTGTGSIVINVGLNASGSNPVYEGIDFRGMYGNVTNNTVGAITINPPAGSASTLYILGRMFGITPTVQNAPVTVSGNLVGSLTTANSIYTPVNTFPPVIIQGMLISTTGSSTMAVNNNTVANITNLSSHATSYTFGIYQASTTVPITSTGNTIRDITVSSQNLTINGSSSIVGLYSTNSVPGSILRGNTVYNLANTDPTVAVGVNAIFLNHTVGSLLCEKNFIHNITTASNAVASQVNGIYVNCSGAYITLKNNMIQLGVNANGTANTASSVIDGIFETGATIDSVLNNSIFIGGAPAAGATGSTYAFNSTIAPSLNTPRVYLDNIFVNSRSGGTIGEHYAIKIGGALQFPLGLTSNYNLFLANGAVGGVFGSFNLIDQSSWAAWKNSVGTDIASGYGDPNFVAPNGTSATANLHVQSPTPIESAGLALSSVTDDFDSQVRSGLTPTDVGADAGSFTLSTDVFGQNIAYIPLGNGLVAASRTVTNWANITDNVGVSGGASLPRIYYKKSTDANAFTGNSSANNGWKYVSASNGSSPFSFTINYALLQAPVATGDIIQYFVVSQDAANNLTSWYPMAVAGANPPVQNIVTAPTNYQSYTIVSNSIPTAITVPGTYATLTGVGGAFDAINQGVLVGNTTISITADLVEPGTVGLNTWAEEPAASNFKLVIKPNSATLRTISGTATLAAGTGLIRTNGASRFTIDGSFGGSGKYLTFRFTNVAPASNGPTIQFTNGATNDTVKNCTIENNGVGMTYGSINVGYLTTLPNTIVIMNNDVRDATGGTTGRQGYAIVSQTLLNNIKVVNNNIYNFNAYGFFTNGGVADGAVVTGNSFFDNSAVLPTASQYCVYFSSAQNNHTISGNYFGGTAALCGGTPWTNSTTNYFIAIYGSVGVIIPTTIANNTIQNINLTNVGSCYFEGIYMTAGVINVNNNLIGSTTVPGSITCAGTGYFYGIYLTLSATAINNVQGNTITSLNYTSTTTSAYLYLMYLSTGLYKVGNVTGNVLGSNSVANSISYAGTGYIYGIYNSSTNPANQIENNIIGNITLTSASGSPYVRGMFISVAHQRKNKIFAIGATNAACTPYIYGMFQNNGNTQYTMEISNNLISLDGGAALNPTIYGYYDYWNYPDFYNVYFNDILISGPATTTSTTYAMYRTSATSYSFYTMYNNIVANKRASGNAMKHYAMYVYNTGSSNCNNNDIYSLAGPFGYYNAGDVPTLAAYQTATGGLDLNSISVDPAFVSTTDLHTTLPQLNNQGVSISGITTDYPGVIRNNPPDIGAYEFTLTPTVVTTAATGVTATTANVNGTINAQNESVVAQFDWGLTVGYGFIQGGTPLTTTGITAIPNTAALAALTPATTYHYRLRGVANATNYNGADMQFTTLAAPPTVVTTAATAVASTTATLNGTVNAQNSTTTVSFDYGLTVAYGTNVPGVPLTINGTTVTAVLTNITGLLPCTTYHFRVNGVNVAGTVNGNDMTFTTNPAAPTAITTAATGVGNTNATINGTINANCLSTNVTFNWGLTVAYGNTVPGTPTPVIGNIATSVSANLVGLTTGVTYHYQVCGTNADGSSCGNDMMFTTQCPIAGQAGPISGPTQVCQGGTGYVYSVVIPNASGYVWTPPVGGTITNGLNTNTITVSYAANASPGYMFVYGTAACGSGAPSQLAIAVNPPASPTIAGPASVCVNSTGIIYTTQAGFSNYIWTVSAGGNITGGAGTNSITVSWTTVGAKTVTVNYNSAAGCPALSPTIYNVTVNPLPVPTIAGPSPACSNFPGLVYSTQAGMASYVWGISAGGVITAGAGTNAITVTWNATGAQSVSVNYTNANGCTATAPVVYPVTVNSGAAPTITGSTTLCANSGYYNYTTEAGMTAYNWSISSGGIINYGSGTNVITVSWVTPGAQWVKVNYINPAGCSAVNPTQLNITVNAGPGAAGSITGTAAVCGGATGVAYSVAAVTGAAAYVWTLPAGATIATGSGTNAITVNFAGNASSGNITVYANNTCGNGAVSPPYAVSVTPLPAPAGTITGLATVCDGATNVVYTVPVIIGATGYTWTMPTGVTSVGGSGTNSITVDFGPGASSGNFTVYGTNSCGNGTVSPALAVTVNPIPAAPVVTNTGYILHSNAPTGNQWYFEGALIPGATAQTYDATLSGTGHYWSIVTLLGCSSPESNHQLVITTGIDTHSSTSINVYPVPNDGRFNVSITTASSESFTISVYNDLGVKIYEETKVDVNGSLTKVIDLRPVANGVYTVIFQNSQDQVIKKVVVNK